MIKLTTDQALSSLLVHDVYLWSWLKAGLTKAHRRKIRSRLINESISVDLKQELLLKCGYTVASATGWYHPDYRHSIGLDIPTDQAFAVLTSSAYMWLATRQTPELRRYYLHCIRTNKPVSISTKIRLLTSAGFIMQPPLWHFPNPAAQVPGKATTIQR